MSDGRSGSGVVPYLVLSWEHTAFWRPNRCGYTRNIDEAGRYSKEEAEAICRNALPTAWKGAFDQEPPEICFPAPEALLHGTIVGERLPT